MTPPPMPIYMQTGHMSPTHHVHHHHHHQLPPEQSHYSSGALLQHQPQQHRSHYLSTGSGIPASSSNHLLNAQPSNNPVSASVNQSSSRSATPYPPEEFR